MAEAFFNRLAENKGLSLRAASAGTAQGSAINPKAILVMEEVGISLENQTPKILTQEMVEASDRVVTMGCGVDAAACPARFLAAEDWGLRDPADLPLDEVRQVRDEIEKKVADLIERLS
jgi:arsenate reductase